MSKLKIVWIDDDPKRRAEVKNVEQRMNAVVQFITSDEKKTMADAVVELIDSPQPDLLLIDHTLTNADSNVLKTGTTAVSMLREKWVNCPAVCVTGDDKSVDSIDEHFYTEVIPFEEISQFNDLLLSICSGFKSLSKSIPKDEEELLLILKIPKKDHENIKKILPKVLKGEYNYHSIVFEIYRWLTKTLFKRPGFLYDELWSATYIGLNIGGFKKVSSLFDEAKFNGPFKNPSKPYWWKSELLEILSKNVDTIGLPWKIGRDLKGIISKDYSKCLTGNEFPETVAFEDDQPKSNRYPMCIKNTIPHPKYNNKLFFEEIRMMDAL